jgi:hypothetical protein
MQSGDMSGIPDKEHQHERQVMKDEVEKWV